MARNKGSINQRNAEFDQLFDALAEKYNCEPVETIFKIMKGRNPAALRLQAANSLMPYRYARLVATPEEKDAQGELKLVWDDGEEITEATVTDIASEPRHQES